MTATATMTARRKATSTETSSQENDVVISRDQVQSHNKEDDGWVIVDGAVYDVTDFIDQHPGGVDILVDYLGKDITDLLQDATVHKHSNNAYSMLDGYRVGRLANAQEELSHFQGQQETIQPTAFSNVERKDDGTFNRKGWGKVDFRKPIVTQSGRLGLEYMEWVHTNPLHFKEPVKLFGPPWMEVLTRTPWYAIPLTWVPITSIILLYLYHFVLAETMESPFGRILFLAQCFIPGFFAWFPIEYLVHKYAFHWDWLGRQGYFLTNILHFLLHGMHHKVPMDRMRLVAPHSIQLLFGIPILGVLLLFFTLPTSLAIACGVAMGYTCYDLTHYALHHTSNPKEMPYPFNEIFSTEYFLNLKTHHAIHHFSPGGDSHNYGITNKIIDIAVNTYKPNY